jgi:hypothetical protein
MPCPSNCVQILNLRLVVLSAGGDNNAPRVDEPTVFQSKLVRPLVASDLHHLLTDHHLSAEFFCLHNRTAGKLLPRNAHWKTEIVLDF